MLGGGLISMLLALPNKAIITEMVTLEVCQSPGCIADGAQNTLAELQALAPPHVIVKEGVCSSICGYGPVVISSSSDAGVQQQKHKKVKEGKILEILFDPEAPTPTEILEAYHLAQQANECFELEEYQVAADMYEKAVKVGFRAAMDLQMERDHYLRSILQRSDDDDDNCKTKGSPSGLEWLVVARRNEAIAHLKLGDLDQALFAAQASCNISRNAAPESFRILAKVYEARNDPESELQSLKTMFGLPVVEKDLSFQEKNERRLCEFRLQKLKASL